MSHLIVDYDLTVPANLENNFQNYIVLIIGHRKYQREVVWVRTHGVRGRLGTLVEMSHLIESSLQAG